MKIAKKNSMRGALLSGLVFPGLGQFVLKHYIRGSVIMIAVLASLSVVVVKAVQQALAILDTVMYEGGVIDMGAIWTAAGQATASSESFLLKFFLSAIILLWIIGTVDAYRIGREKDLKEQDEKDRET
jgi:hypothetical protein